MTNNFKQYRHKGNIVLARQVTEDTVVKTDYGKIVLHPGDWEIYDEDGTHYGNTAKKFDRNFERAS
jgi:hypothetical protein